MWPFRRRKNGKESQQAILDATKALREVVDRDKEVRETSGALRLIRERNHFAEQLKVIMEGGHHA
jgi:predicted RNA-binding Zn ribbon-like protein